MVRKRVRPRKPKKAETKAIKEYLKQLPLPPEEHAYELKMERRLKRLVENEEKKKPTKGLS
ncbi:MAG: hypothetical protein ACUVRA_06140 [Candidatus Bathyarchaeaceae archaeon]